jgi:hypothetical protein
MHDKDLAEYLAHDPLPEEVLRTVLRTAIAPANGGRVSLGSSLRLDPAVAAVSERDQFVSDVLRMVLEIFPGARWTTRAEYTRASAQRDRQGRKRRR